MIGRVIPKEDMAQGRSILVVDDEPTIAEIVARYLTRAGYQTRIASDGPQALAMSAESPPDLVVLDIMLPGIDGLEVMRTLHAQDRPRSAIILLTAKGQESDRIIGLRRGADDYVLKPFSPGELVARVEAVLRRHRAEPELGAEELQFDGLRIEPATRSVWAAGEEVSLTQREFDLLVFLAQHPGRVFSRDQLMELVWQLASDVDSSTVTVHIRRLRAKIEPDPERPRYLQTVWGVGYRFHS
jgi:DNA-binding response OmpR family regulator